MSRERLRNSSAFCADPLASAGIAPPRDFCKFLNCLTSSLKPKLTVIWKERET